MRPKDIEPESEGGQVQLHLFRERFSYEKLSTCAAFMITGGGNLIPPAGRQAEILSPDADFLPCAVFNIDIVGKNYEEYQLYVSFRQDEVDGTEHCSTQFLAVPYCEENMLSEPMKMTVDLPVTSQVLSLGYTQRIGTDFFQDLFMQRPLDGILIGKDGNVQPAENCRQVANVPTDGIAHCNVELFDDLTPDLRLHAIHACSTSSSSLSLLSGYEVSGSGREQRRKAAEFFNESHEVHLKQVLEKIRRLSKRKILYILDADDLAPFFDVPRDLLAKRIGISVTLFKKICRRNGIKTWPYRQLQPIDKKISQRTRYHQLHLSCGQNQTVKAVSDMLQREIEQLRSRKEEVVQGILATSEVASE